MALSAGPRVISKLRAISKYGQQFATWTLGPKHKVFSDAWHFMNGILCAVYDHDHINIMQCNVIDLCMNIIQDQTLKYDDHGVEHDVVAPLFAEYLWNYEENEASNLHRKRQSQRSDGA